MSLLYIVILKHIHILILILCRDIKPDNLLLFNGGSTLKIADMGLSRELTNDYMTNMQGTRKYLSPGNFRSFFVI